MCVTTPSSCSWIDHKVSRLPPLTDAPCSDSLSLRLLFLMKINLASEEQLVGSLCKRHAVTTHIAVLAPTACRRTVSGTISLPYPGCFSPFPYGTGSLSIDKEYLALPDGTGRFRQDSSGPALLRILLVHIDCYLQDFHPLWSNFPDGSV